MPEGERLQNASGSIVRSSFFAGNASSSTVGTSQFTRNTSGSTAPASQLTGLILLRAQLQHVQSERFSSTFHSMNEQFDLANN
jgi:hypothetical protein